jgi:hypothetical protein
MVRPSFFILGAPKCGTTALSEYLGRHPDIGFSQPKEPRYFCTDFPDIRGVSSEAEYLAECFGHCGDGKDISGEGSTIYFYSCEAIPNILRFSPDARFIVMLRNPVDMIHALHAQRILGLEEDVRDFEQAWHLCETRASGSSIPKNCKDRRLVDYKMLGKLDIQLTRIYSQVPPGRLKVILFDDLVRDARSVYLDVLEFLGVEDDGKSVFPKVNASKKVRSLFLHTVSQKPPECLVRLLVRIKSMLGMERLGITSRIRGWNVVHESRQPLSTAMRKVVLDEYSDDIDRLALLINRDLSHWKEV